MIRRMRDKLLGLTRSFARRQDGAAAVEFALVATPFFALIFAIMETALVFFAGQTLEAAASDSARLIMTGQAQAGGYDNAAGFKQKVCANASGLFDCNKIQVDVKKYTSFGSYTQTSPVTDGELDTTKINYESSAAGDIVVVTLYYEWPVYVSLLGNNLSNLNGNNRLLVATAVFRNEPFGTTSTTTN
jgi:Flp pilus assembly protein TadG